jgi:hypothetical protein
MRVDVISLSDSMSAETRPVVGVNLIGIYDKIPRLSVHS